MKCNKMLCQNEIWFKLRFIIRIYFRCSSEFLTFEEQHSEKRAVVRYDIYEINILLELPATNSFTILNINQTG